MHATSWRKSIVLTVVMALAMVVTFSGPSQADPRSREFSRRDDRGAVRRDAPFTRPRVEWRRFDGGRHHHFPRDRFYGSYGYAPFYGYAPSYGYSAPATYWYCPAYAAYYPSVTSCPGGWVTVPAY